MNYSKPTTIKQPIQESETLRLLRMKFHSYSKSQQISNYRPTVEQSMKSTFKENEGIGWRQSMKSPIREEGKYLDINKTAFTQKVNIQNESEFTKKARELLAKSLSKRLQSSNLHLNAKTIMPPKRISLAEKS